MNEFPYEIDIPDYLKSDGDETELGTLASSKRRRRRQYISTPSNLMLVTPTNSSVVLTWDEPTGLFVDGYIILRDDVKIADVTSNTYTDTGLTPETTYSYIVYAYNRFGGESPHVTDSTTLPA